MMLGGIMGPLDASIVNVVLPTIASFFEVPIGTAQWVPMTYLLAISSLLLFYGRLGDIWGYKKIYLSGLAGFVVTSALCGFSQSIHWLIAFRALQGLAAGMMMSVPYAIIVRAFPDVERGKALGVNAIMVALGLAIGPSLGGFIAAHLGWRFVFLINVPIGIAAAIWGSRVIPEEKGEPGRLDIPGAVLAFLALLSLLLLVNRFHQWDFFSMGCAGTFALSAVGFVFREKRTPQPMLRLSLFSNRLFSLGNFAALLNFMSQYILVFVTPFYLQRALHYAANEVGLVMTSFPVVVLAVAPFAGSLSDRIGSRFLSCAGAAICALSLVLLSQLLTPDGYQVTSLSVAWRLGLFGLGTGLFQSPNNSTVMGNASRPHLGIASGILATMRNMGMVLGIATAGAVLYSFVPAEILAQPHLDASQTVAFISGLRYAYMTGGVLTGVASIISVIR
jgi:EmrB/QacA subfamily drug resistance transporter